MGQPAPDLSVCQIRMSCESRRRADEFSSVKIARTNAYAFRSVRRRGKRPGVILLRETTPILAAVEELVLIWTASEAEEWINRLVRIPL